MASVLDLLRSRAISRTPSQFGFSGHPYPLDAYPGTNGTMPGSPVEASMANFTDAVRTIHSRSGPVAAAISARSLVLSQVHFKFRSLSDNKQLFGNATLGVLEKPSPDMTRQAMLTRIETDVAYSGTAYVRRLVDGRLTHLRPDWMQLLIGSNERPDDPRVAADAELIGFVYKPGGASSSHPGQLLARSEVMMWAPEPHPLANFIGEAWVSAVYREIAADMQATDHVSKFFDNAATPNTIMIAPPEVVTKGQFEEWVDAAEGAHRGAYNAWKTIYLQAGADAKVVGAKLGDIHMNDLQGGFETRVAARSRVPATVLLIREGMQGSALNAGNYSQTRRLWADSWFSPYAQAMCAAFERIVPAPSGSELTFDPSRVLLLQEDEADEADIWAKDAQSIRTLVDGGFIPATVIDAFASRDVKRLKHSGLAPVQVQPTPSPQESAT